MTLAPHFDLQSTADALEVRLRARRLFDLPAAWTRELVYPAYDGLSLLNVPHTVAALLGAPLPDSRPLDAAVWGGDSPEGRVRRVIVIVSDGLAYGWLRHFVAEDPTLAGAVADLSGGRGPLPLTSICPSTTTAALSTLWTGASPAAHGLTGFRVYLREINTLAIPLFLCPALGNQPRGSLAAFGLKAEEMLPVPGLIPHLAAAGVPTYAFLRQDFANSGIALYTHRGLRPENTVTHLNYADAALNLRDLLARTAGQRCYINIYLESIDALCHAYGASAPCVPAEMRRQLSDLAAILADPAARDGQTLVLFTADHGHADAPQEINLKTDGRTGPIRDALRGLASGEMRLTYLHLSEGSRPAVVDCLAREFADDLAWLEPAEALAAGLFGPEPPYAETIHRLGDLIVIPRPGVRVDDGLLPPSAHPMISAHGGLSDLEMLIPLLWNRL